MQDGEAEGLIVAQSRALAAQFILEAVVMTMAKSVPNPEKVIEGMYESVSRRLDAEPLDTQSHPVSSETRDTIERFFVRMGQRARQL